MFLGGNMQLQIENSTSDFAVKIWVNQRNPVSKKIGFTKMLYKITAMLCIHMGNNNEFHIYT